MSRLRKGKKYTGGSYAKHFNSCIAMKSPLNAVAVAGNEPEDLEVPKSPESPVSPVGEDVKEFQESPRVADAAKDVGVKDVVPKKKGSASRRSQMESYWAQGEQKVKDAEEKAKKEKEAEEAAAAELEGRTVRGEDGDIQYVDDYKETMTGKERRAEGRENKAGIKEEFKSDKADIKARRKAGELTWREKRDLMKDERKEKRDAKKGNRQGKKWARKGAKSNKKKKKGKKK